MSTVEFFIEHEDDPLAFDCPDCGIETDAHLFVDRRDTGSGCTWVICERCYGGYNTGMWEIDDVLDRVSLA